MNFSDALRSMNQGHWVRRQSWYRTRWIRIARVRKGHGVAGVSYLDFYLDEEGGRWIPKTEDVAAIDWARGVKVIDV